VVSNNKLPNKQLTNRRSLSVYRRQALLTARADAREDDDERPLDVGGPGSPPPAAAALHSSCEYYILGA
jgi:hypothetical protein